MKNKACNTWLTFFHVFFLNLLNQFHQTSNKSLHFNDVLLVLKNVPNVTHENDNSHWFTKVPWHLIVQRREGPHLFMTCQNFCCRCIIILSYFGNGQQLLLCPTANN